jgi:multidrug efflux pump subunit AcrA (membrane-fusion protein)
VTIGVNYGSAIVIAKGVKPGETVVTDGQLRLGPGAKAAVQSAEGRSMKPESKGTE